VQDQRLGDLFADAKVRRQRGQRILEHHGHAPAAQRFRGAEQVFTGETCLAAYDGALAGQPHQREKGLALAGAGLADDAQATTAYEFQRQGLHHRLPAVRHGQVAHLEQGLFIRRGFDHRRLIHCATPAAPAGHHPAG
jgi:hypothetical protein